MDLVFYENLQKTQKFRSKYVLLCSFLKAYKEKMLLTKKVTDSLDEHIITVN